MAITFRYKTVTRSNGQKVRSPLIPVVLVGKESIPTATLLDSGADVSALSKDFAEIIGLDLSGKREKCEGIGGVAECVLTTAGIIIEKGHERYQFRIPVEVIFDDTDWGVSMLLGRAGFFDKFIISFNESEEKVSLKRVTKNN